MTQKTFYLLEASSQKLIRLNKLIFPLLSGVVVKVSQHRHINCKSNINHIKSVLCVLNDEAF